MNANLAICLRPQYQVKVSETFYYFGYVMHLCDAGFSRTVFLSVFYRSNRNIFIGTFLIFEIEITATIKILEKTSR